MDGLRRRMLFALGALATPVGVASPAAAQADRPPTCRGTTTLGPWRISRTLGEVDNFGENQVLDILSATTPHFGVRITLAFSAGGVAGGAISIDTKTPVDPAALVLTWPPMPVAARIDGSSIRVGSIRVSTTGTGSTARYELDAETGGRLFDQLTGGGTLEIVALVYDPEASNGSRQVTSDIDLDSLRGYETQMSGLDARLRDELAQEVCRVQAGSGGGCFLTTACCVAIGLPDDCYELRRMRRFRDTWLVHQPGGLDDLAIYRREAPQIAAAIEGAADRDRICRTLYFGYILPALALGGIGLRRAAWRHYARMFYRARGMVAAGVDAAGVEAAR